MRGVGPHHTQTGLRLSRLGKKNKEKDKTSLKTMGHGDQDGPEQSEGSD
jgi:hypothetical protein